MKKILILTLIAATMGFYNPSAACTNYIITKGASADGSVMISYAADSHIRYGELYYIPGGPQPAGSMYKIYDRGTMKYLGEIPQPAVTYTVIGFMNDHQVAIGETTFGGVSGLEDTTGMIDYASLMFLGLQRAKTAREAIKVMAELVDKYGYFSSGESFSVGDANEAWIFEMIGKGTQMVTDKKTGKAYNKNKGAVWVAIRIPDGYISAHANQARITTFPLANGKTSITSKNLDKIFNPEVEVVYSSDVISFAKEKGLYKGKDEDFSFSDTYNPVTFEGARFCEIRVWSMFKNVNKDMWNYFDYAKGENLKHRMPLYIKPDHKLTPQDLMANYRDHLEGTELDMSKDPGAGPFGMPYRWRPLTWKVDGKEYFNERATATQQTAFSFIAQLRSWMPDPIGGIFWIGVDDAATTVYVPIYAGIRKAPESYAKGNGDMLTYSETSAFWTFNKVANFTYLRYDLMVQDVKKVQKELEDKYAALVPEVDKAALKIYSEDPERARDFVSTFSIATANSTVARWNDLFHFLLVKYIDGNVKKEKDGVFEKNPYGFVPNPSQPGYPEWWLKQLVKETGNKFELPEEAAAH